MINWDISLPKMHPRLDFNFELLQRSLLRLSKQSDILLDSLMSSRVCLEQLAMAVSMSFWDNLKLGGDHLSNFSEYFLTASSPSLRIVSITSRTTPETSMDGDAF